MASGFFSTSQLLSSKAPASLLPKCGACGWLKHCKSPKLRPVGKGGAKILLVGEQPTQHDDEAGRLLSTINPDGPLEKALRKCGVDVKEDCWYTTAAICHPTKDSNITDEVAEHCHPHLWETIEELRPERIVLLGLLPVRSLLGRLWKEDVGNTQRWHGWQIPCQRLNAWVCPTMSPAYVHKQKEATAGQYFQEHIEAAFNLYGRPWNPVPDYKSQVRVEMDVEEAAVFLRWVYKHAERHNWEGMLAVDYETDRLKPDKADSRIVCCSICYNGKHTIAYPWHGPTIEATGDLLWSPLRKIASNLQFEERWSRAKLGQGVRNWFWDTMLAAHGLDVRPNITSIKFQSFVRLGQESYNDHIAPLLEAPDANSPNRIREVDLAQLLLYCGMDSLLEYHVASHQMEELERGQLQ